MSFLVVGESLVDVVTAADGTVVESPGGSPLNVAVGLGRLGAEVELLTAFADDPHGAVLRAHLAASGVVVRRAPLARTSVALASLDATGAATYEFRLAWDLAGASAGAPPSWLHVGSLGVTQQPGAAEVARLVDELRGTAVVSYDPNCRPSLMGAATDVLPLVEEQVRRSDVVKLSVEDAAWLCPGEPVAHLARRWLALGPAVVVVTAGADGARAWTAEHHAEAGPRVTAPLVDTVGAGDAFMSGLLWVLAGTDPRRLTAVELVRALGTASRVAGRTCERRGADPPWRHEL